MRPRNANTTPVSTIVSAPAARPGVTNGFEITVLARSLSDEVRSVDDVGVRGGLAQVLYSFEPRQNF